MPLCALCIAAVYCSHGPAVVRKDRYGNHVGPVRSVYDLTEAHDAGHFCFQGTEPMALGVIAQTYVHGIAMCVMHSLYVVTRLDLDKI